MIPSKPDLSIRAIQAVLQRHWKRSAEDLLPIDGGNFSCVYSFAMEGHEYVIRFSDAVNAFQNEQYISSLLSSQGVPYPKIFGEGKEADFNYCIRSFGSWWKWTVLIVAAICCSILWGGSNGNLLGKLA